MNSWIKFPFRTLKTNAHPNPTMDSIYMCIGCMTNVNEEENTFCYFLVAFVTLGIRHFNGWFWYVSINYNEAGCCVFSRIAPVPYCFWELWGYRSGLKPLFYGQLHLFLSIVVSSLGRSRNDDGRVGRWVEEERRRWNRDTETARSSTMSRIGRQLRGQKFGWELCWCPDACRFRIHAWRGVIPFL